MPHYRITYENPENKAINKIDVEAYNIAGAHKLGRKYGNVIKVVLIKEVNNSDERRD